MTLLTNILAFLVVILILVSVHEFGHFWVARKLGVKVLRFSIGFGQSLWTSKPDALGTQYLLCAIPLGGYVKMLDESEGEVPDDQKQYAFNRKPVHYRMAIVAAGPMINLVFALLVYWLLFVMGVDGIKPIVGEVTVNTPASVAGLHEGDRILAVNGEAVISWEQVTDALLDGVVDRGEVRLDVESVEKILSTRKLDLSRMENALDEPGQLFKQIGIAQWLPKVHPLVVSLVEGSAAAAAGLQAQDVVLQIQGEDISSPDQMIKRIRVSAGKPLRFRILRNASEMDVTVTPEANETDEGTRGQIGANIGIPPHAYDEMKVLVRYSPIEAAGEAWHKTVDSAILLLKVVKKMIVGEASLKNISGPATIAEFAGKSVDLGFGYFLNLLAMLSLTLGVFNLLPIPVLDGGHIFYQLIEAIKGSPLSENVMIAGQWIGISVLGLVMALAFYNDYIRIFG